MPNFHFKDSPTECRLAGVRQDSLPTMEVDWGISCLSLHHIPPQPASNRHVTSWANSPGTANIILWLQWPKHADQAFPAVLSTSSVPWAFIHFRASVSSEGSLASYPVSEGKHLSLGLRQHTLNFSPCFCSWSRYNQLSSQHLKNKSDQVIFWLRTTHWLPACLE